MGRCDRKTVGLTRGTHAQFTGSPRLNLRSATVIVVITVVVEPLEELVVVVVVVVLTRFGQGPPSEKAAEALANGITVGTALAGTALGLALALVLGPADDGIDMNAGWRHTNWSPGQCKRYSAFDPKQLQYKGKGGRGEEGRGCNTWLEKERCGQGCVRWRCGVRAKERRRQTRNGMI